MPAIVVVQIHARAPFSKKHVDDELLDVSRHLPMFPDHDNQLPSKSCRHGHPDQLLPLIVKSESPQTVSS